MQFFFCRKFVEVFTTSSTENIQKYFLKLRVELSISSKSLEYVAATVVMATTSMNQSKLGFNNCPPMTLDEVSTAGQQVLFNL